MDETRSTLLERVRDPHDSTSWREFYRLYQPLLYRYARKRGLGRTDAEDISLEVMGVLSREMASFEYTRSRGRFKSYLWKLVTSRISRAFRRKRPQLARSAQLDQPGESNDLDEIWERCWLKEHLQYCLGRIKTSFSEQTIAAFTMYALQDEPIEQVCDQLQLSRNQVYLAKSRVTNRLRREMKVLLGDIG